MNELTATEHKILVDAIHDSAVVIHKKQKMNNRIFESIQNQNGIRGLLWTEEDKEEFAELIVRECASLAYDGPSGILEYFGVDSE